MPDRSANAAWVDPAASRCCLSSEPNAPVSPELSTVLPLPVPRSERSRQLGRASAYQCPRFCASRTQLGPRFARAVANSAELRGRAITSPLRWMTWPDAEDPAATRGGQGKMWGSSGNLAGALVPIIATLIIVAMVAVTGGRFGGADPPFPDAADGSVATCVDERCGRSVERLSAGEHDSVSAKRAFRRLSISKTCQMAPPTPLGLGISANQPGAPPVRVVIRTRLWKSGRACSSGSIARHPTSLVGLPWQGAFARLHPRPGSEVQMLVFHHGVMGRMHPPDRVRLLVAWPVAATGHVVDIGDDRRIPEPLVGRAVIRLLESPETSDAVWRSVAGAPFSIDAQ